MPRAHGGIGAFVSQLTGGEVAVQVLPPRRAQQGPSLALAFEFLALIGAAAHLGMEAKAAVRNAGQGCGAPPSAAAISCTQALPRSRVRSSQRARTSMRQR